MILELPKKFNLPCVEVTEDNQLMIFNLVRYEDLMYELTYALKKKKCAYCGKKLNKYNRTLDHKYPKYTGGISITNNLAPSCSECNTEKSGLTQREYLEFIELENKERKKYLKVIEKQREKQLSKTGYVLPNKWIEFKRIDDITYHKPDCILRGKKYNKILQFYNKYKQLPRPIIVDKEYKLLDGYNILLFAEDYEIKYIPVIVLENVMLCTKEKEDNN